ncbi:MAG: DUF2357 domain-containing protein [Lachnospiraceae bacterium]|nr:DUF2357 domain-containing protein [Lachnospiraceae bacterium]
MANSINDLYLKYANKVGRTLESDRYFQYLFEMVQAGSNVFQQKYQVMHKVVDERWLATIENSIDAINEIIDKPRRFVTTKEEVVPVALAKKITADSVRHLSMNTQFIASSENGDIQPTRVLNVSTEESYNLYENRFIYHLIQRLVTFIDKRTDVIFWATGDETQNVLNFQSQIDDAYEEIQYKIEMTIKNRQSFAENESDNMQLFMRIDRVRRMVLALKRSSFCDIMAGCSKVRSPIQRTNLIMKDPNYRTCYQLWQFLENYDDVGYTIEVQDSALEFDEEYMIQMYTNLITNYTVFKSLMEGDSRRLEEVANQKRRIIRPKFIKKIKEEFVEDRNIEDVEIRRVFVEEVTQAQLDAEAALERETEARKQAEQNLEDMDAQMIALQQQVSNLMMMNQEAEVRAEEERQGKEAAQQEKEAAEQERDAALQEAQTAKQAQEAAEEQAKQDVAAALAREQSGIAAAQQKADAEIAGTKAQAEKEIADMRQQADTEIAEAKAQAEGAIADMRQQADTEIAEAKTQAEKEIADMRQQADTEIAEAKTQAEKEIADMRQQADTEIAEAKQQAEADVRAAEDHAEESRRQAQESKADAKRRIDDALHKAEEIKTRAEASVAEVTAQLQTLQQEKDTLAAQSRQRENELTEQVNATKNLLENTRKQAEDDARKAHAEQERLTREAREQLDTLTREKQEQLAAEQESNRQTVAQLQREHAEAVEAADRAAKSQLEEVERRLQERIAELERRNSQLSEQLDEANTAWEQLEERLEDTEQQAEAAREQARRMKEKAEANTLSHYIISRLNNRKQKQNTPDGEAARTEAANVVRDDYDDDRNGDDGQG